jgi:hypothetical protein
LYHLVISNDHETINLQTFVHAFVNTNIL